MRFKSLRGDYWTRLSLMASVLVICLIGFFVWERYVKKQERPAIQPAKHVVHKKMPARRPATVERRPERRPVEEKHTPAVEIAEPKKKAPTVVQVKEQREKKKPVEDTEGIYRVRKGDSLFKIAGREEVYGNPFKWPSLFRLNMGELNEMAVSDDLEHRELPAGLGLRFVTPEEASDSRVKLGKRVWVVNALSSQTSKKIVPAAVKLMRNGYRVYISSAVVKGKKWMRLRVGFFGKREEASSEGKKIRSLLEADDAWIDRIGKQEIREFGGY